MLTKVLTLVALLNDPQTERGCEKPKESDLDGDVL
jgi:hypothetical protein